MNINTGVYLWRNTRNGKVYVGKSGTSLRERKMSHVRALRSNTHANPRFQRAWNKYGADAFEFEIIECCPPEVCEEREICWIIHYRAVNADFGYNICFYGTSLAGVKLTPEHRAKISAANKGKIVTAETRAKMSAAQKGHTRNRGRKLGPEVCAAISNRLQGHKYNVGHVVTAETRERLSAALRGRKQSPELIAKRAVARRGIPRPPITESTRQKLCAARARRVISAETRRKNGLAHKGKTVKPETRQKIAAGVQANWEKRRAVSNQKTFFVYLLECNDGSFYCGMSYDPSARVKMHNSGRGAKYTKTRRPVTLIAVSKPLTQRQAMQGERLVKSRRTHDQKVATLARLPQGLVEED